MSRPRRVGKVHLLRPAKLTVACPHCDVTWRGTLRDPCWNCGRRETVEAAPPQVKIVG